MKTEGIEGWLIETHNWGKTVAFWKGLGYELEFETDHHSGQLRHPAGGTYLCIAERPASQVLQIVPAVAVKAAAQFAPPPQCDRNTPVREAALACTPDASRRP